MSEFVRGQIHDELGYAANKIFVTPNGEIRFTNERGWQLFHDKGHLSGYGSDIVKRLLVAEISQILAPVPATNSEEIAVP